MKEGYWEWELVIQHWKRSFSRITWVLPKRQFILSNLNIFASKEAWTEKMKNEIAFNMSGGTWPGRERESNHHFYCALGNLSNSTVSTDQPPTFTRSIGPPRVRGSPHFSPKFSAPANYTRSSAPTQKKAGGCLMLQKVSLKSIWCP